eukprot:1888356-Rhodomonas_salina.5
MSSPRDRPVRTPASELEQKTREHAGKQGEYPVWIELELDVSLPVDRLGPPTEDRGPVVVHVEEHRLRCPNGCGVDPRVDPQHRQTLHAGAPRRQINGNNVVDAVEAEHPVHPFFENSLRDTEKPVRRSMPSYLGRVMSWQLETCF